MMKFTKFVFEQSFIRHAFTSVMTWLLALLVTVGHDSWTQLDKIQAHTPPSPAFQSHVETCQRETLWSSEHWVWIKLTMLGRDFTVDFLQMGSGLRVLGKRLKCELYSQQTSVRHKGTLVKC